MSAELTVRVDGAAPYETDATNNSRHAPDRGDRARARPCERARPEPRRLRRPVQQPRLRPDHAVARRHGYRDFEAKAKALQPHIVRIFYNDNWDGNRTAVPGLAVNYASFVKVVRLAQEAGATIDISFQNLGNARSTPGPAHGEVRRRARGPRPQPRPHERPLGGGRERAEHRRRAVTLAEYDALVPDAGRAARRRGLRDHIRLMGGGLVENAGVRRGRTTSGCSGSRRTWATSSTPRASTCTGTTTTRDGSSTGSGTSARPH